jgi:hypothetical protein
MAGNKKLFVILIILFVVILSLTVSNKAYYNEESHPILIEIKRRISLLSPKYANIPLRSGNKAFTEDKSVITICLQDPKTGEYYNMDILMYVALHELAHVITKAEGDQSHGDEFKNNFARLLKEAANKNIYDPRQPIPSSYCGNSVH